MSVWGMNSGLGNDWHHGDFILHLAGKQKQERERLALKYTT